MWCTNALIDLSAAAEALLQIQQERVARKATEEAELRRKEAELCEKEAELALIAQLGGSEVACTEDEGGPMPAEGEAQASRMARHRICDLLTLYLFSSNYTGMRYMLKNEYFDGDEIRYVSNISVNSFLL